MDEVGPMEPLARFIFQKNHFSRQNNRVTVLLAAGSGFRFNCHPANKMNMLRLISRQGLQRAKRFEAQASAASS